MRHILWDSLAGRRGHRDDAAPPPRRAARTGSSGRRPGRRTSPRPSRARRAPLRLRRDRERRSGELLGRAHRRGRRREGPPRRAKALAASAGRPRSGSARRAPGPSRPSSPGSRPRSRRSSSSRRCRRPWRPSPRAPSCASSRVSPSSVPVITYCVPVSGPSTGRSPSSASKLSPSGAQLVDEPAVVLVGEPLGDRLGALGADPLALDELLRASRRSARRPSRSGAPGSAPSTQPTSGMLSPKSTRRNGICFDCSIAAIALRAEISP